MDSKEKSKRHIPNAETLEAMQEVEDMISGKSPKNLQTVQSLFEELEK